MNIGRNIYFDKEVGIIIQDTGERSGNVVETTLDQDFEVYVNLAERVRNTVDVIELEYGDYAQDFQTGQLKGIDPVTKELLFSYPDPQTPGEVTPPQPALSEKVKTLESDVLNTQMAFADTFEQLLSAQAETTSMQLALVDVYEQLLAFNV
ncbi:hypothetical protein [Paenibacillus wynnii]|uniref:hypothetical protein n=1 Tax=Paenibacillus wynnii TaxID=268407 RepID=UPI00278F8601|nr:hypothetical protein [Paenibacillus wynnii]MDQ0195811.1 hypothetical protein [Paenibacillus wynnii]